MRRLLLFAALTAGLLAGPVVEVMFPLAPPPPPPLAPGPPPQSPSLVFKEYFDYADTAAFLANTSTAPHVQGTYKPSEDLSPCGTFSDCVQLDKTAAGQVEGFDGTTSNSVLYLWPAGTGTPGDPESPGCKDQTISRDLALFPNNTGPSEITIRWKFKASHADFATGDPDWGCTSSAGYKFSHIMSCCALSTTGRMAIDLINPTSPDGYDAHLYGPNDASPGGKVCSAGGLPQQLLDGNWHTVRHQITIGTTNQKFIRMWIDNAPTETPTCEWGPGETAITEIRSLRYGANRNQRNPGPGRKHWRAAVEVWSGGDPGPGGGSPPPGKPGFRPRGGAGTLVPRPPE